MDKKQHIKCDVHSCKHCDCSCDCCKLREIEIPRSVISIGEFLFKNCNDICVYCSKGSYAEKYAKRNKIYYK